MVKRNKTGWLIAPMIPEWIPLEQWEAYVRMRKKIKKPLTEYAALLAIKKLDDLRKAGHNPKEVLEQSIFNAWQGLFEVKTDGQFTSKADQRNASISDTTRKVFGSGRRLSGHDAKSLPDKTSGE